MTGRKKFNKYNKIINIIVSIIRVIPLSIRVILFNVFRNLGGKIGLLIRYVFIKTIVKKCGNNVSIHPGCYILNIKNISIGNNVSIHPLCYLDGYGGITIGNDVSIAHNCSILSTNHSWEDKNIPIKYNKTTSGACVIKSDVWIGCGSRILSNVVIGTRSIVAAGAVVTKNIEANSIYGGVPAKKIKKI